MKIYFSFLKMQIKRQMQYRLSLALMFFAQILTTVLMLLTIYLLMDRFNVVDGWNFKQILLTYGVVMFSFSFTECFFRGMDTFASFIKSGSVDRMLVRPRGVVHQALCCDVELSKCGRVIVAIATLVYGMCVQDFTWTFGKVMILIGMCVCGIVVFLGLFMLGASWAIFTIDGIEVVNIFTDGGRELCQYPLNIYGDKLQKIFTFVIPYACFNILPMKYLYGMEGATLWNGALAPVWGMLFIIPCYLILRLSLRKYESTGT